MPTPSLLIVPARFKSGKLYSQIPTSGDGDFTVTRATAATRVNASGFIESVASGIPRLDYFASGGTVGCPALLVEPSATNGIRNNSMVGAVTGTPGTLPTGGGWTTTLRGLTQTIVDTGTENGIAYIDIRFSGTATSTNTVEIRYESDTQIVASSGQVWTHSVYLKKIAEPNPPNNYQLGVYERTSGGVFVSFGSLTIVPTTTIQRFTQTRTLSGATTARVQPALFFAVTSGSPYDFSIRVGYPQMETGSVATSVIPTTTGSVTRNADVVSVSGAVSGSIGQTEGTFYLDLTVLSKGSSGIRWLQIFGASNNIGLAINASNQLRSIVNAQSDILSTAPLISSGVKVAWAYDGTGTTCFINGTQYTLTNGGNQTMSSLTSISIDGGVSPAFGFARIRAAALYNTRLTNDQLAALTTP